MLKIKKSQINTNIKFWLENMSGANVNWPQQPNIEIFLLFI